LLSALSVWMDGLVYSTLHSTLYTRNRVARLYPQALGFTLRSPAKSLKTLSTELCAERSPYIAYERSELTRWKTPLATPRVLLRHVIRLCPPATAINTRRSKRLPTVVWRHLWARSIALSHAALRARYPLLRKAGEGLSKSVTISKERRREYYELNKDRVNTRLDRSL
jgi:hypothetical protein